MLLSVLGWPGKAGSQYSVGVMVVLTMVGSGGSEAAIIRLKYFCFLERCVVTGVSCEQSPCEYWALFIFCTFLYLKKK